MKATQIVEEKAVFVDVQGTLVLGNRLNEALYTDMKKIHKRGAQVIIFTMAAPTSMAQHLTNLGVDTKRFPVVNKFRYRSHLFTGLIIDDLDPQIQGFQTSKGVYDEKGHLLHNLVKQLDKNPQLTFKQALKNHRTQAPLKASSRTSR